MSRPKTTPAGAEKSGRIYVTTRLSAGAYTVAHKGTRASSASSAAEAVQRLTVKLWGEGPHGRALLKTEANGDQQWGICKVGRAA